MMASDFSIQRVTQVTRGKTLAQVRDMFSELQQNPGWWVHQARAAAVREQIVLESIPEGLQEEVSDGLDSRALKIFVNLCKGVSCCIVGGSGSGKTHLYRMILKFLIEHQLFSDPGSVVSLGTTHSATRSCHGDRTWHSHQGLGLFNKTLEEHRKEILSKSFKDARARILRAKVEGLSEAFLLSGDDILRSDMIHREIKGIPDEDFGGTTQFYEGDHCQQVSFDDPDDFQSRPPLTHRHIFEAKCMQNFEFFLYNLTLLLFFSLSLLLSFSFYVFSLVFSTLFYGYER